MYDKNKLLIYLLGQIDCILELYLDDKEDEIKLVDVKASRKGTLLFEFNEMQRSSPEYLLNQRVLNKRRLLLYFKNLITEANYQKLLSQAKDEGLIYDYFARKETGGVHIYLDKNYELKAARFRDNFGKNLRYDSKTKTLRYKGKSYKLKSNSKLGPFFNFLKGNKNQMIDFRILNQRCNGVYKHSKQIHDALFDTIRPNLRVEKDDDFPVYDKNNQWIWDESD